MVNNVKLNGIHFLSKKTELLLLLITAAAAAASLILIIVYYIIPQNPYDNDNGDENSLSVLAGESGLKGMIDSSGGCAVPFIFDSIEPLGSSFFIGSTEDGVVLIDGDGSFVSEELWDGFGFDDNEDTVTLSKSKNGIELSFKKSGGRTVCSAVSVKTASADCTIEDADMIMKIGSDKICSIFEKTGSFFEFSSASDDEGIKKLTGEQFYKSVSDDNGFRNCSVNSINNIKISLSDGDSEDYVLSADVEYSSRDKEDAENAKQLRASVKLSFVNDRNIFLALKSVSEEEL